jgi:hypothetical protein
MLHRERAVAVAKDVLANIRNYRFHKGSYLNGLLTLDQEDDAKEYIDNLVANCEVCLLGACVLSMIRLYDGIQVGHFLYADGMAHLTRGQVYRMLSSVFDQDDMDLMEAVFECDPVIDSMDDVDKSLMLQSAAGFGRRFSNKIDRVQAVMENIIEHNGEFILPTLYKPVEPDAIVEA